MFFYILFVIWCYCTVALMLMLEQPHTRIPNFFILPSQQLRTSEVGCDDDKAICLYERGRMAIQRTHPPGGRSGHGQLADYANADERDRWRSSWLRFPQLVRAVVAASHNELDMSEPPDFRELRERFAVEWYRAGLPVPYDYDARDDALPLLQADRDYLSTRGKGHGRTVQSVVPRSLREGGGAVLGPPTLDLSTVSHHELDLRLVTARSLSLCFVAMQSIPLVFAYLNGFSLLGADLHLSAPRSVALAIATRWAENAISAASSTFLIGEYSGGARLFAAPLNYNPPEADVVRTPAQRRTRARAGATFAWCTLAALAGCMAYDPAGRAAAACSALRGPVSALADAASFGHARLSVFTTGVFRSAPLVDQPDSFTMAPTTLEIALGADWRAARVLKERILELGRDDEDLGLWAQKIQPPQLQDVPAEFLTELPTFEDARFASLRFSPDYEPPHLPRLLPRPPQTPVPPHICARSVYDLMPAPTVRRIRAWLWRALDDLICMRDHGVECERHPPATMVVGRDELYEWARHHVWDFRLSPQQCAVALDYQAPLRPTLNADFFARELKGYPNQRLLGMIETGVIYMADVELQSLFVRHLISLPKGFKAVGKELRRLKKQGWYDFTPHIPFWPLYFNAQGSQARKLEPDRDRRTTEGGAPRDEMWDKSGLKVISINDASRTYHLPQHYATDLRPEFLAWMQSRHLPPTPEDLAALESNRGTKWGQQYMPNLRTLASNLAVLKAAAVRLQMPLYIFGNDIKDFFNHLENAPSELPLMNLIYLGADDDLAATDQLRAFGKDGEHLVFVSERRMGFGIHPNSGIAQELSESIDFIFRRRMDAVEDPLNEADPRPSMQRWLSDRRALEARVGGHQRRLYSTLTYCDDNIIGVIGVDQAIRALRMRRGIEREAGLIMAIPEKRMLGTWGLWLGILIFAQLGFVLVPRSKLVRASQALSQASRGELSFDAYRSLIGLLEHIRHALHLPRKVMHGLYFPHGPHGEGRHGPSTLVQPNFFMATQLVRWLQFLAAKAGSFFTAALKRASVPDLATRISYFASSDAATDSNPPGLGGFMHGMFWYLALSSEIVAWLHISVLELLATGFSAMIFHSSRPPRSRLVLGADASATVTTLTRQSESSEMLMLTHHELLEDAEFAAAAPATDLGQLRGDANLAADAVSRAEWEVFFRLCRNLRIRPIQLEVPESCLRILQRVLAHAQRRGIMVRPNPYQSTPTTIPPPLLPYVENPVSTRSVAPRTTFATSPAGPRCERCGALLPRELFGLGRCPSCVDYDGPGSYAAARRALRETAAEARPEPTPVRTSRLQRARREAATPAARQAVPPPACVPVVLIGGQRFPVPPHSRVDSKRKRSMLEFAHARAVSMAASNATPEQIAHLKAAVAATHELAEYGAASGTLDKDDRAWEFWERFNKVYGWDAIISPEFARTQPHEISQRLAIFQAWVYPQIRGLRQHDAKPRSVFNGYVLAVIRILNREHVPMPKAKHVERNLAGLMRSFKTIYGHEALMPGHRQPFTPAMWARIEALPEGATLAGRVDWSPSARLRDRNLLRLGRVLWRTGHRLGEIVWHPSGEVNYLTRASLSISKASGAKIAVPCAADWRALAPGDSVLLAPCTSKTDQFGEEHCPFPSILPFDGADASAAASIRDIELEQPCLPADRDITPLFCDQSGAPFSYSMLHSDLRALLSAVFGKAFSQAFSWHSIRIGLACALHAADAPDAVIQLICRWASPESLRVYRQMGIEKNTFWVGKAQSVTFDATRVNNLPALDRNEHMQEQMRAFDSDPVTPSPAPVRIVRTYIIPNGTVQAHPSDTEGLVGLLVRVPRSFWNSSDVAPHEPARIPCTVAAECARLFRHPDGSRTRTYLLACNSQYFPIKRDSLIRHCLTSEQRDVLGLQ